MRQFLITSPVLVGYEALCPMPSEYKIPQWQPRMGSLAMLKHRCFGVVLFSVWNKDHGDQAP